MRVGFEKKWTLVLLPHSQNVLMYRFCSTTYRRYCSTALFTQRCESSKPVWLRSRFLKLQKKCIFWEFVCQTGLDCFFISPIEPASRLPVGIPVYRWLKPPGLIVMSILPDFTRPVWQLELNSREVCPAFTFGPLTRRSFYPSKVEALFPDCTILFLI